jgi:SAM-dependent MidA family methyltransferase
MKPESVSVVPPQARAGAAGALELQMQQRLQDDGGWWPFDRFMQAALYTPGLGYYARDSRQFGLMPSSGSDFVTAPELSPLFGQALAQQVLEGLDAAGADEVWEFGAGSGALAAQLLDALGDRVRRYTIVDVSGSLRARQQQRLAHWGDRVQWAHTLPAAMQGVLVGNEVLDAMPVRLLAFDGRQWLERGVALHDGQWVFQDRPSEARPPFEAAPEAPFVPGTVTEIHEQAEAFVRTLADRLTRGLVLLIDYGFPEAEYYHPQRTGGTLMCHRAHQVDSDPLSDIGDKDITAHVNFTGIALAAQDAGLDVLGYISQARFLLNCGLMDLLADADLPTRAAAQKLITEHEMGELFKVLALGRGLGLDPLGFSQGDRMHRL